MIQIALRRMFWMILLLALQVVVFNHVHLYGYATPMPYVYALLILPAVTPRWLYVLLGFALGLCVDVGANTPGMAAAAGTLTGLAAPFFLHLFAPKEFDDDSTLLPSVGSMGWGSFLSYVTSALLLHVGTFYAIEDFAFYLPLRLFLNILGSTVFSILLIIAFELLRHKE